MVTTTLYLSQPEHYFSSVVQIFKDLLRDKSVIYVTTNKPYPHLVNLLKQDQVDTNRIFFIDCITKQILSVADEPDNCIYINSPHEITAIGIAVSRAVEHLAGEKYLFLDSLSTLLLYNDEKIIGQFSNFMINKMLVSDVSSIIMVLSSDVDKEVIKQIMSFVDEVKKI
jgi:hypothetical protein